MRGRCRTASLDGEVAALDGAASAISATCNQRCRMAKRPDWCTSSSISCFSTGAICRGFPLSQRKAQLEQLLSEKLPDCPSFAMSNIINPPARRCWKRPAGWTGRRHLQARRCAIQIRPRRRLDESQMPWRPGGGDRRLARRSQQSAFAARGCIPGWTIPLHGPHWHRLQCEIGRRTAAQTEATGNSPTCVFEHEGRSARATSTGLSRSSSRRWNSAPSHRRGFYGRRATKACAKTSRQRTWSSTAARGRRVEIGPQQACPQNHHRRKQERSKRPQGKGCRKNRPDCPRRSQSRIRAVRGPRRQQPPRQGDPYSSARDQPNNRTQGASAPRPPTTSSTCPGAASIRLTRLRIRTPPSRLHHHSGAPEPLLLLNEIPGCHHRLVLPAPSDHRSSSSCQSGIVAGSGIGRPMPISA